MAFILMIIAGFYDSTLSREQCVLKHKNPGCKFFEKTRKSYRVPFNLRPDRKENSI